MRLTLDEAVKFALERNLDIAVQRLNPEINDIAIASISSVYHPSLTSIVESVEHDAAARQPDHGRLGRHRAAEQDDDGTTAESPRAFRGAAGRSPRHSRTTAVQYDESTATCSTRCTSRTGICAYAQPLLRNFRIDSTRQQLQVTKLNRDISDVQLRATITNTLSNVRNAYWDYVFAVQAVEVAQQSLDLASKLVQDNQTRVEIGTMAPIDVVQAQSEQATRRQALVDGAVHAAHRRARAEAPDRRAAPHDPNWAAALDPTDRPDFQPAADRHRGGRPARARASAPIRRSPRRTSRRTTSRLKYLRDQTAAAGRPADVATACRASAARSSSATAPASAAPITGDDSRRLRRRVQLAVPATAFRRWTVAAERHLSARRQHAGGVGRRARACS